MNSRPYSKSWRAVATRCRTPSRRLALPIKSSPRRPSVCDKSEFRCRGEGDHLTSRPDARGGKPGLGDRARQSVTKKKIHQRRNINAIRAFFWGRTRRYCEGCVSAWAGQGEKNRQHG